MEQSKVAVTRTITVSDLTPQEIASIITGWSNHEQAQLFDAMGAEAANWPGMGWQGQALSIAQSEQLSERGARVVWQLAEWLKETADQKGWVL